MDKITITREEPDGPLRKGLRAASGALGVEKGGGVFLEAYKLANAGLDAVLDLHHLHRLGHPDHSIPPPLHSVAVQRGRGEFTIQPIVADEVVARL